ncbi:WXG100 family type VII secretion target [Mycobacteroides abscessus subsp. abscessus]|uniref:WXG100 family type VII secretion target n=1 Tax=Mycobacteroides abscessus TaxID=36809 RepID=UPI0009A87A31|nr:WXG100 family type VII secretion target [Mycobacteroides abscessus]QSM94345.1 WXG100 family type VII secretion target [Mycobacteroides abscessus subsp. abscessus]QSM99379.1 WXG100 family type VII secretion target [Mycobacteroides abscessus subsp. abscessus]SLJ15052.1 WXG100 family type VII secretion target [Mycobacteroides abscessus subsp. abscessus]
MPSVEPLRVDPDELRAAADRLDAHAETFSTGHRSAHSQAGQVRLGSGLAAAALTEMLTVWEADGARFGAGFAAHAEGDREAASRYERTDGRSADNIGDVGSGL